MELRRLLDQAQNVGFEDISYDAYFGVEELAENAHAYYNAKLEHHINAYRNNVSLARFVSALGPSHPPPQCKGDVLLGLEECLEHGFFDQCYRYAASELKGSGTGVELLDGTNRYLGQILTKLGYDQLAKKLLKLLNQRSGESFVLNYKTSVSFLTKVFVRGKYLDDVIRGSIVTRDFSGIRTIFLDFERKFPGFTFWIEDDRSRNTWNTVKIYIVSTSGTIHGKTAAIEVQLVTPEMWIVRNESTNHEAYERKRLSLNPTIGARYQALGHDFAKTCGLLRAASPSLDAMIGAVLQAQGPFEERHFKHLRRFPSYCVSSEMVHWGIAASILTSVFWAGVCIVPYEYITRNQDTAASAGLFAIFLGVQVVGTVLTHMIFIFPKANGNLPFLETLIDAYPRTWKCYWDHYVNAVTRWLHGDEAEPVQCYHEILLALDEDLRSCLSPREDNQLLNGRVFPMGHYSCPTQTTELFQVVDGRVLVSGRNTTYLSKLRLSTQGTRIDVQCQYETGSHGEFIVALCPRHDCQYNGPGSRGDGQTFCLRLSGKGSLLVRNRFFERILSFRKNAVAIEDATPRNEFKVTILVRDDKIIYRVNNKQVGIYSFQGTGITPSEGFHFGFVSYLQRHCVTIKNIEISSIPKGLPKISGKNPIVSNSRRAMPLKDRTNTKFAKTRQRLVKR